MLKVFNKLKFILQKNKKIYFLDSKNDEQFIINSLMNEKYLGLDTEFDWRRTYFPELSLLQISTTSKILLIDHLSIKSLGFLKEILEDTKKMIIIHSSRSDTTVLNTNLNINLKNIFDIQIAEKYLSGGEIKNYGSLVHKYLGLEINKSETNSNWLKRPLSDKQLDYASNDVNFLIPIFQSQKKILKRNKMMNEIILQSKKEADLGNQQLHVSRVKKLKNSSDKEKEIFLWREKQARDQNVPPSYIFEDRFLKKITKDLKNKNISKEKIKKYFRDSAVAYDFIVQMKP